MGGRSRIPAFALALLLTSLHCDSDRHPAGASCASGPECESGLCLEQTTGAVCVARCTTDDDCGAANICGRYDFRGVDEAGVPDGDESDVVRVCRPPLQASCAAGCAAAERCVGTDPGVCAPACRDSIDCSGRDCIADCAGSYCAPACDSFRDCPHFYTCDTAFLGTDGHSRCVPAATGTDAGAATDAACVDAH